uniref:Unannotated protein n=1 Tax=freshwater metagenome TaxID=449393 RepID=A0A6J6A1B3_9ZZZZ
MPQGRRDVLIERRLSVGTSVAAVEAAERVQRFFGPCGSVRRRGESKTVGQEHGLSGDVASGVVVTFDQFGRHRHRVPDVGKALAADAVDGKLAGLSWPHVHASEIAYRVVVLRVAQPTQRYLAGITGPGRRFGIECRRDPAQQLFPLGLIWLRRILRRHVATAHPLGDIT